MRLWKFGAGEHRAVSVTDQITQQLLDTAGANAAPLVAALGAVQTAAGWWGRAFASATVTPAPLAATLTPAVLSSIGHALADTGEWLGVIDTMPRLRLLRASSWEVTGGVTPETWTYRVTLPMPNGKVQERTLSHAAVVHLRYRTLAGAPWRGVSPLGASEDTRNLAGWIERRLAEEASTATAYMLPLPEGKATPDNLRADLKKGKGKLLVVDSVAGGWGAGKDAAPKNDWMTVRIGANPAPVLAALREAVSVDVLALYGVPSTAGTGTASREAYRQFVAATAEPLGRIVESELADKLNAPAFALDFGAMRAADLTGRARAYGQLVTAGKTPAQADAICGFDAPAGGAA